METPNRSDADLDDACSDCPFTPDRTLRLAGQYAAFLRQAESYALAGLCEKCVNMVSHVWIFTLLALYRTKCLRVCNRVVTTQNAKAGC